MTPTFTRPAIALALALALAGCGGKASFPVSGTVTGLIYSGLVLTTNGMDLAVAPPAAATSTTSATFTFPNTLSYGEAFAVTPKSQPLHQTCTIFSGGADTAGHTASINVDVRCGVNSIALGGSITGLTSAGLVLTNGSTGGTVAPAAAATIFALPAVPYGVSYGVTVLTQPASDVCSVSSNGTGVMTDTPVSDIVVTCVPK